MREESFLPIRPVRDPGCCLWETSEILDAKSDLWVGLGNFCFFSCLEITYPGIYPNAILKNSTPARQ